MPSHNFNFNLPGILNIIGNQEKYMKILILALLKNGGKNKQHLKEDIQIQKIKK